MISFIHIRLTKFTSQYVDVNISCATASLPSVTMLYQSYIPNETHIVRIETQSNTCATNTHIGNKFTQPEKVGKVEHNLIINQVEEVSLRMCVCGCYWSNWILCIFIYICDIVKRGIIYNLVKQNIPSEYLLLHFLSFLLKPQRTVCTCNARFDV